MGIHFKNCLYFVLIIGLLNYKFKLCNNFRSNQMTKKYWNFSQVTGYMLLHRVL